ncbi:hypothetical protein QQP08_019411 [Theobroma cacao]|nr:hypothetical protein QQP08_019411 [Theobroma cacao]
MKKPCFLKLKQQIAEPLLLDYLFLNIVTAEFDQILLVKGISLSKMVSLLVWIWSKIPLPGCYKEHFLKTI